MEAFPFEILISILHYCTAVQKRKAKIIYDWWKWFWKLNMATLCELQHLLRSPPTLWRYFHVNLSPPFSVNVFGFMFVHERKQQTSHVHYENQNNRRCLQFAVLKPMQCFSFSKLLNTALGAPGDTCRLFFNTHIHLHLFSPLFSLYSVAALLHWW